MCHLKKYVHHSLFLVVFLAVLFPVITVAANSPSVTDNSARCEESVSASLGNLTAPNTILIDVREAKYYNLFHIEHSLNIKPHQIATKSYLKNKNVILIGNGYHQTSLHKKCRALKQSGFVSVSVLKGGVQAFVRNNRVKIDGNEVNQSLYYLTPQDMLDITKPEEYLLVNITGQKDDRLKVYLPRVVTTSGQVNSKPQQKEILTIINKKPKISNLLIVGADNFQYPALYKLNQMDSNKTIFFLKGGLSELTRFEKNIKAILGKKEFTLSNIKGCSN